MNPITRRPAKRPARESAGGEHRPVRPTAAARRPAAVALLLAATVVLTACGAPSPNGGAAASTPGEPECPGGATPFAELAVSQTPRELTGPATACLADTALPEVDSDEQPAMPVTVTDASGTEVTVESADRILALDISGTLAATVFALGLGDRVVGRDSSTGFAAAAELPVVTHGGHSLTAEAILSLDPDVVITDTTLGPRDVLGQLRDAGIPVVTTTQERTVDNVAEVIGEVAAALGVPERGRLLTEQVQGGLDEVTAGIRAAIPAEADRPRTLFLYVRGNANVYYLFGEESGADSLIEAAGGRDVAGEIGWTGMRPITAEALVEAAPDVVLLMTGGLESAGGVDGLLERLPALASTPAGEHRRFIDMADTEILGFGPRTPAVVDALARAIYVPEGSSE
ncbi:heme/hemin ABC transporter substrate-binding protein [Agromyces archimandritae]|uniref:ABC transporter substrate-binding protein n=1 Tax=Agromyces archimandritae TaxID=2781962 RepID=A0A975FPM9_9MICO|nr:ABC transporter substrate-binding protein [Agromyces archimandritae]QTX05801.1 ABC transporter substrate-binding protein [Agromyces archimandritae]